MSYKIIERNTIKRKEIDNLLHHLWTKAVGTKDYDKKEWQDLERRIWGIIKSSEKVHNEIDTINHLLSN